MRYNIESCAIEMSAEELCTLALRHGDLDAPPVYSARLEEDGQLYYVPLLPDSVSTVVVEK